MSAETIESLRADLDEARAQVLAVTYTEEGTHIILRKLRAAELDKANLAREVDHLQRESAHAHERIAAALAVWNEGHGTLCAATMARALTGGTE